jgi:hypothetical protein
VGPALLNAAGLSSEHTLDEVDVDWLKCHHVFVLYPLLFHESQDGRGRPRRDFFITPVYLQSVQNTMSKWEETETNGEEESSVALIHMEEAQGLEW